MLAKRFIGILALSWLLASAPLVAQDDDWGWQEVAAEYASMLEEEAAENPRMALWTLRNIHMEVEWRDDAVELLEAMVPEFESASMRQMAEQKLKKLKNGSAPWPMDEDQVDEVIWDLLEADGSSELVQAGGLKIRLNFRDGIHLMDGSIVEWTAARKRPYVRAALEWLQVLRGVQGVDEHELTIDFVGLPVNFCNGFAEVTYEDLRKVGDNWIPAAGIICINSIFYERDTLLFEDWRDELFHNALHEMGHVFGVGSMWNLAEWEGQIEPFHPLDLEDPEYADEEPDRILREWVQWSEADGGLIYRGPNAVAAFQRVHETDLDFVPISEDGGHLWAYMEDFEEDERVSSDGEEIPSSDSELMAHRHVLSEITIGFLDDIGWEVDYDASQPLEEWEEDEEWEDFDEEDAEESASADVDWQPQSKGVLKLVPTGDDVPNALAKMFPKEVDVFGVKVLATAATDSDKVLHAASLMAEYLDNDEDGTPDNEIVIESMRSHHATLLMTPTEAGFERMIRKLDRDVPEVRRMIFQSLYGSETHPNGAANGVFDVAYEEVLHLVTHAGYSRAYPDAFGEHPGTLLTDAMDVARGGHFKSVPRRYPKDAWYTYYDDTCEYRCQAAEYLYWGITSLLGAQNLPGRLEDIRHEWRFDTKEKLRAGDKLLYQLLTDPQYQLPTVLPDGNYRMN